MCVCVCVCYACVLCVRVLCVCDCTIVVWIMEVFMCGCEEAYNGVVVAMATCALGMLFTSDFTT